MKSFSTRQPRFLVLCASVAVSAVLFSGIASTFQHAGDSALYKARMAKFEQSQADAKMSANAAPQAGNPTESGVAESSLVANSLKNSAKL